MKFSFIRILSIILSVAIVFSFVSCKKTEASPDVTPDTEQEETIKDTEIFDKRQSVLLIGQSNMAGRGDTESVEPIIDDRIFMIRGERFIKMQEPIHFDKPDIAGVGLGASFANAFVETFDCEIGLIPGAFGGTSLFDWRPGGSYYNRALEMALAAQNTSEICAILWHQGESDLDNPDYTRELKKIFDSFIKDLHLDAEKIVIITGELADLYYADYTINKYLMELGSYYENYGVASAENLSAWENYGHFDAPSLRVFGYRYFDIFYNKITGKNYTFNDDPNAHRINLPSE